MKFELTPTSPVTEPFDVHGDCYICIKGEGEVSIERRLGESYEILTTDRGEPLAFVGDGVLYNNSISCSKAIKHRVVAKTAKTITVELVKGGR